MKINKEDIKVGLQILSWDEEDGRWYNAEVKAIDGHKITLIDVDKNSVWRGMEWDELIDKLSDTNLYKQTE